MKSQSKVIDEKIINKQLQKDWEIDFDIENFNEWISAGLSIKDSIYARWLIYFKGFNARFFLKFENKQELKKEYENFWKEIENSKSSCEWKSNLIDSHESLICKLIPNPKLKKRYREYGLCKSCQWPNSDVSRMQEGWCQICNAERFQLSFQNWSSGHNDIDDLIQYHQLTSINHQQILEWIPYQRFTNVEYLTRGNFGEVYKAKWIDGQIWNWSNKDVKWERFTNTVGNPQDVVLKSLGKVTIDFLQEVSNHKLVNDEILSLNVVNCLGISQDPKTKNYLMVMEYIKGGNLRQYLIGNRPNFRERYMKLISTADGLDEIHKRKLIHKDLHPGNILVDYCCFITDLGLSRSANETDQGKLYGVLPYVAPEVLQGQSYTKASDIYSFGIIAYEIFSNLMPYYNLKLDYHNLRKMICQELRPDVEKLKIPSLLKDLIKQCWDTSPDKRPTAEELSLTIKKWQSDMFDSENNLLFFQQYQAIKDEYDNWAQNTFYQAHSSQLIDTKEISELLKKMQFTAENTSQVEEIIEQIRAIKKEITVFKKILKDELISLVESFIEAKIISLKNSFDKELENQVWDLENQLIEEGMEQERIDELTKHCEDLVNLEQQQSEQLQLQTLIEDTL